MANPFQINPLGGFNLGGAIAGLGRQFGEEKRMRQQQSQEAEQQAMMQDLQRRAFAGDQEAINQLAGFNMQGAISAQNRVGQLGAEQDQVKGRKTAEYIAKGYTLPEEQRAAYFQAGITNPELDIDEEDVPFFGDARIAEEAVRRFAPEMADTVFAKPEEPKAIKTTTIQTPTGARVVNTQSGETVSEIVDPAKKQEFELKQKERKQKIEKTKQEVRRQAKKEEQQQIDATEARKNTVNRTINTIELADQLTNIDEIEMAVGPLDRLFANTGLTPETDDLITKALQFKDSLTLDNLKLMQGPLTDKDIEILASEASGIRVDEDGFVGSAKGVVSQVKKVKAMLIKKLEAAVKRGDLSQQELDSIKSGQAISEGSSTVSNVISDRSGYDSLPVGAEYVYDGKTYIKGQ